MTDLAAAQRAQLEALGHESRLRRLIPRAGRDFASNDYLGLAASPVLREAVAAAVAAGVPVGSGGSRLLRGNHEEHEALEAEAAAHFGSEGALFFATGFAANAALFGTLPQREDLVVYDELIHASVHDGMKLGRARFEKAPHNDVQAIGDIIAGWRNQGGTGRAWIAVESLYGMDGDRAPLTELLALAGRHEAWLVVDEAHATGVFGTEGRGLTDPIAGAANLVTLHTCGKALGVEGGLLCGPQVLIDFLVNRGRPFIFSTAPSPLIAHAVRQALRLSAAADEPRATLRDLYTHANASLAARLGVRPTDSQIIPVIIGDNGLTMRTAAALQAGGFDVRGIRPPTVPQGTARLRLSLTLNVSRHDIDALVDLMAGSLAEAA